MARQQFLPIVGLLKQSLTAPSCGFLSVLAILVLVPAVAAAGDQLSSWDKQMNAKSRFEVLRDFDSAAVLDKETGLVWEQSPNTTTTLQWNSGAAASACANKNVGGRKGWRLPSIHELASLIDPSVAPPGPTLPPGHPFTSVQPNTSYWSATTHAVAPSDAWLVYFGNGSVDTNSTPNMHLVWCVRGGGLLSTY